MSGTPWHPYPGENRLTFKDIVPNVKFAKEPAIPSEDAGTEREARLPRFHLTKADLRKHEKALDCTGCTALGRGKLGHHSNYWLKRFEDILCQNNDKRMIS